MITLDDLKKYRVLIGEVNSLKEQIQELELTMVAPKIPALDAVGGGRSSGGSSDKIGDVIARKEKLLERYYSKLDELVELVGAIENWIESLDREEQLVVRRRYVAGEKWEQVAEVMGVEVMTAHRIHRRAIGKL